MGNYASPWSMNRLLITALLLRFVFVFYAKIHDYLFEVSFTDVDYRVFSDAAELVSQGKSPFDRPTYRYTPFLAWILLPNVVFPEFGFIYIKFLTFLGKILFCFMDILVGWLHFRISLQDLKRSKIQMESQVLAQAIHDIKVDISVFWLFNPFIIIISTRGSSDSLVSVAVLLSLYLLNKNYLLLSAIIHGALAIHLKIYPIIYLPSIFLYLLKRDNRRLWIWDFLFNQKGYLYVMVSILFFLNTLALGYIFYENKFLEEFLLYHIRRKDIRHNFSPYFYPLYLAMDNPQITRYLSLGAFIPQIVLIVAFAFKYRNFIFKIILDTITIYRFVGFCQRLHLLHLIKFVHRNILFGICAFYR